MARKDQQDDDSRDENLGKDSDDNFGLPEINYEPLRKEEETTESESSEQEKQSEYNQSQEPVAEEEKQPSAYEHYRGGYEKEEEQQPASYSYKSYAEEESSVWPKVLGILLVIIIALAAAWYFAIYKPKQDQIAEKERIEAQQRAKAQKEKQEEEERARREREETERQSQATAEASRTPEPGTIETLNDRTGRYYVVVASAIDSDLLMDYANRLSKKGISCKIIPPYGKYKVSRITIAEGDTFNAAAAKAEELKGEFGTAVWVLKY
jgi:hypothetical protein